MRFYISIATLLSLLFGLLPVVIAKTTDQGDELCDPEFYYAAEQTCVLLWDRTFIAYAIYVALAAAFFVALALIWKAIRAIGAKF